MPYSVQAKHAMLDALGAVAAYGSVHDASPGSTGASEAAGSVRAALTWEAAGVTFAGLKRLSATASVTDIPAAFTVSYVGLWSAASGGTFYGYQPVSSVSTTGGVPWTYVITSGQVDLDAVASA